MNIIPSIKNQLYFLKKVMTWFHQLKQYNLCLFIYVTSVVWESAKEVSLKLYHKLAAKGFRKLTMELDCCTVFWMVLIAGKTLWFIALLHHLFTHIVSVLEWLSITVQGHVRLYACITYWGGWCCKPFRLWPGIENVLDY